jgi:hypothetical protein
MKRSELRRLIMEELKGVAEGGFFTGGFSGEDHHGDALGQDQMKTLDDAGINRDNLNRKNLSSDAEQALSNVNTDTGTTQELSGPIKVSDVMALVRADRDTESTYKMADNFYSYSHRDQLSDEEKAIISQ